MKPAVEHALEELRQGLPDRDLRVKEDPDGGALVMVEGMEIGQVFSPSISWIGFHITWPYPDADVYPHFIDPKVQYVGTGAVPNQYPEGNLPTAMTRGATMPGFEVPAIQVSRRSNRRNAETDSALEKLLRVVEFLRGR
jgi:hypothetical protein